MNTTIIKLITLILIIVTAPLKVHVDSVQNPTDDTIEKRYAIKGNPALPPTNFKLIEHISELYVMNCNHSLHEYMS